MWLEGGGCRVPGREAPSCSQAWSVGPELRHMLPLRSPQTPIARAHLGHRSTSCRHSGRPPRLLCFFYSVHQSEGEQRKEKRSESIRRSSPRSVCLGVPMRMQSRISTSGKRRWRSVPQLLLVGPAVGGAAGASPCPNSGLWVGVWPTAGSREHLAPPSFLPTQS